jgi:hypothetical protein
MGKVSQRIAGRIMRLDHKQGRIASRDFMPRPGLGHAHHLTFGRDLIALG